VTDLARDPAGRTALAERGAALARPQAAHHIAQGVLSRLARRPVSGERR